MKQTVRAVGDRLLVKLLKQQDAGACVPEMGETCACITDQQSGYCRSDHVWIFFKYTYKLNCYGSCATKTSLVCGQASSGQYC